ncbi:MAG: nucleotide exchange factor GrpE [Sulfurihydrogenibium sp.]
MDNNQEKVENLETNENKPQDSQENITENQEETIDKDQLIEQLKKENEELKAKLQKTEEAAKKLSILYQTIQKDFEDYKARMIKEREQIKEEAIEKFAKAFLEVVDNFEKAIESFKYTNDINSILQGIQMTHYQVVNLLKNFGIEKIEAEGDFNPQIHEAIETVKSKEYKPNQIVKILQHGYTYKGKVIRPAKVVVSVEEEEIT